MKTDVNRIKTVIVSFTNGKVISFAAEMKYPCIILDWKLTWTGSSTEPNYPYEHVEGSAGDLGVYRQANPLDISDACQTDDHV